MAMLVIDGRERRGRDEMSLPPSLWHFLVYTKNKYRKTCSMVTMFSDRKQ
jgi:hypothetical protein